MQAPKEFEEGKKVVITGMELGAQLIVSKMSPLNPGSLLLDFGCGAGGTTVNFFLPAAEAANSQLHALDISPKMIQFAKESNAHPRIEYFVGNIFDQDFPLKTFKYDKIFSTHVFHHIQDYKSAVVKLQEMLKPGGELCFTVLGHLEMFQIYWTLAEHPKYKDYMKGIGEYIPNWYKGDMGGKTPAQRCKESFDKVASEVGLQVLLSETHDITQTIASKALIEMYLSVNPLVKNVPSELMDDLGQLYRQLVATRMGQEPTAEFWVSTHQSLTYIMKKLE